MKDLQKVLDGFEFVGSPRVQVREVNKASRKLLGLGANYTDLLSLPSGNAKLAKGGRFQVGLSLAPSTHSGINVCRHSTPQCRAGCVAFAGRGRGTNVSAGRLWRTRYLEWYPQQFCAQLFTEIERWSVEYGNDLRVRLNMFSDLRWELILPDLFDRFPLVKFYDYTKWPDRVTPPNYRLVYSVSERTTVAQFNRNLVNGVAQAAVFRDPVPYRFMGVPVVDGDSHDDRWSDPDYAVIGLTPKGEMRKMVNEGMVF